MRLAAAKEISVDASSLSMLAGIFSPLSKTNKDKWHQKRIFSELFALHPFVFKKNFYINGTLGINVYFNCSSHTSRSHGAGAKLAGRCLLTARCNK